ncbi:hypothetical protein AMAG_20295 [Allomyces macrogynus ATCC 38327]|uniref:Uncharacterized protein n=1 Tax=Allomyces macrogynus (strain ATCC 38327) TaxID=578462 RepID=A0A0L0T781_ALLM3|nr:hypothetical protein AMAG_20295 [Allomyces macrogynus ATCC 38327]|eukprot:KNE70602.1 hypothetical protein AMAG_20295 [Allomyces macrogynus ATCC 38327]
MSAVIEDRAPTPEIMAAPAAAAAHRTRAATETPPSSPLPVEESVREHGMEVTAPEPEPVALEETAMPMEVDEETATPMEVDKDEAVRMDVDNAGEGSKNASDRVTMPSDTDSSVPRPGPVPVLVLDQPRTPRTPPRARASPMAVSPSTTPRPAAPSPVARLASPSPAPRPASSSPVACPATPCPGHPPGVAESCSHIHK